MSKPSPKPVTFTTPAGVRVRLLPGSRAFTHAEKHWRRGSHKPKPAPVEETARVVEDAPVSVDAPEVPNE